MLGTGKGHTQPASTAKYRRWRVGGHLAHISSLSGDLAWDDLCFLCDCCADELQASPLSPRCAQGDSVRASFQRLRVTCATWRFGSPATRRKGFNGVSVQAKRALASRGFVVSVTSGSRWRRQSTRSLIRVVSEPRSRRSAGLPKAFWSFFALGPGVCVMARCQQSGFLEGTCSFVLHSSVTIVGGSALLTAWPADTSALSLHTVMSPATLLFQDESCEEEGTCT